MADGVGPRLTVVTPWYPGVNNRFAGAFVQQAIQSVQQVDGVGPVRVLHAEDWAAPVDAVSTAVIARATRELTTASDGHSRLPELPVREGTLLRAPSPARARAPYAVHARSQEEALRLALRGRPLRADVVHGHVGIFGGWVGMRLREPGTPLVVTEHATFLHKVLAQDEAREMYDEVLAAADRFFAVGRVLQEEIVRVFPHHRGRVQVLPNAVAVERMAPRADPVRDLRRWLYVGRLLPHKGVLRLLEVFAVCAARDPRLELTLLGGGRAADELRARAARYGLADRVHLPGPVPHEDVVRHMHEHDLLVHLSERETFGMTVVEAVACGLPVLVTRSGGPDETLEGLEGVAGATVPVGDDVDEVVTAFDRLRDGLADLDLAAAREVVRERYGQDSVGRRLSQHYQDVVSRRSSVPQRSEPGASTADTSGAPAARSDRIVVLVAMTALRAVPVVEQCAFLLAHGASPVVVTEHAEPFTQAGLDPAVRLMALAPAGAAGAAARPPRPLPRPVSGVVRRVRTRLVDPAGRVLRPYLLWRAARRQVLPRLDWSGVEEVVVADSHGVPLAWRLARRYPGLRVVFALDRRRYTGDDPGATVDAADT